MPGRYGAAADIGTTTIAVKVYDLVAGICVGEAACRNSQYTVVANVMGVSMSPCTAMMLMVAQDIKSLLLCALTEVDITVKE